ncbi:MAG: ribonuclease H family protein [Fibrobacter sp.]|nr:ribonuclease H family protein [Fibrobacter sp.]
MPKVKFYAIKAPEKSQIVDSWAECESLTHGIKGVLFKSFATRAEAEAWIAGIEAPVPAGIRVFVDGSFSPTFAPAGWAYVVVDGDKELARGSGITAFPAESRNIDGEVMASYQAMRWLDAHDMEGVICHDYEGVARWAKGEWQAKSNVAKQYVNAIRPYVHRAKFEKVAAHTGVKWNELVDKLAKEAIEKAKKASEKSEKKD